MGTASAMARTVRSSVQPMPRRMIGSNRNLQNVSHRKFGFTSTGAQRLHGDQQQDRRGNPAADMAGRNDVVEHDAVAGGDGGGGCLPPPLVVLFGRGHLSFRFRG